ncbi:MULTISPECIES: AbrB family transcriptional regulator [unclassified Shinella]|uniref:AbrB family transcriptional regulator n=1 Tax=unclassified Shinella TaxID=2643062 RepID=UPI00234F7B89|nr:MULTISPECIES: AbrB family transcriptional regulator [unclassified Shinella]MCO5151399.1 AbrB family transcriptional regulator [Shinella sp.]
MARTLLFRRGMTVLIAAAGVAVFLALHLPLPFLFGPMAASLVAALFGAPLAGLGQVSIAARSVLGIAIGTSVTPALIAELPSMVASLALVPVYIVVIGLIGVPFFRRVCGFVPVTAFYAAMPGGAADMTIFGQEAGANVRQLSLVHVTRLMVIMVVAPIILVNIYGVGLTHPVGPPASDLPVPEMLIMAVAALVGWKGGERIGLFGAAILGPLLVSAVLSLAGILHLRPPREALLAAQFLIGMGIGVSYVGVTLRELRNTVTGGAAFVLILAALAGAVTELVTLTGLAPPVEGFLAFIPGGQAEMSMLALVSGADLSFVVVHHLTRILVVILGAPILFRLMRRAQPPG